MSERARMSPWTALFIGLSMVSVVGIVAGMGVTLFALDVIDDKADAVLHLTENTIEGLPKLLESLPGTIDDILSDHRAPEYIGKLTVGVSFLASERSGGLYPAVTITNGGDKVVSMLGLRVAALGPDNTPLQDWGDVVATPIALDDGDWPGPLMPGQTRYVVMSPWRTLAVPGGSKITAAFEISEIRVWQPRDREDQG